MGQADQGGRNHREVTLLNPHPYRLALAELRLPPERVLFVAGSGFDLIGTAAAGMTTLWHNRADLARPPQALAPLAERRTPLDLM